MYILLIFALSFIFYRQGMRALLKSKILVNTDSALIAYLFLMLSGVTIGEYLTIHLLPYFFTPTKWNLIISGTFISIVSGEFIYYRNNKLVSRIVTSSKND